MPKRNKSHQPRVGEFVLCYFPDLETNPGEPGKTPSHGLILRIEYDKELGLPCYVLAHATPELERNLFKSGAFSALADQISGRVPVSATGERVIDISQVTILPVCGHFFPELREHAHIISHGGVADEDLLKFQSRSKIPNRTALMVYRMEESQRDAGITPNLPITRRILSEASSTPAP